MPLRDDIELARRLLREPLSPNTKPTEREARAAARRVLHTIPDLLLKIDNDLRMFLIDLGFVIDPAFRPRVLRRHHTRKVDFSDATPGSGRTRTANAKHLAIARRVRELRKAGAKAPVSTTAKEFGKVNSVVSRICADPGIKEYLAFLDERDAS